MRFRKRLVGLLSVLGALVILYLAGRLALPGERARLLFPGFQEGQATAVTIKGRGVGVELERGSDSWWLTVDGERFPADAARVRRLLGAVASAESVGTASSDPKTWGSFLLEPEEAVHLVVSKERGGSVELFVGKSTPSGGGDYVRLRGAPQVLVTAFPLATYLGQPISWWSQLKILPASLSPDLLQEIGIRARGFRVGAEEVTTDYLLVSTLTGGSVRWNVQGHGLLSLDPKRLLELEGELLGLTGESFVTHPDEKKIGLDDPVAQVLVVDSQGRRWLIDVGKREGSSFYVKREDRPYVYLVNQYALRRLIKPLPELSR